MLKQDIFIPDNEMWLYTNDGESRIDKAMEWHDNNPRRDNYDEIIEKNQIYHDLICIVCYNDKLISI